MSKLTTNDHYSVSRQQPLLHTILERLEWLDRPFHEVAIELADYMCELYPIHFERYSMLFKTGTPMLLESYLFDTYYRLGKVQTKRQQIGSWYRNNSNSYAMTTDKWLYFEMRYLCVTLADGTDVPIKEYMVSYCNGMQYLNPDGSEHRMYHNEMAARSVVHHLNEQGGCWCGNEIKLQFIAPAIHKQFNLSPVRSNEDILKVLMTALWNEVGEEQGFNYGRAELLLIDSINQYLQMTRGNWKAYQQAGTPIKYNGSFKNYVEKFWYQILKGEPCEAEFEEDDGFLQDVLDTFACEEQVCEPSMPYNLITHINQLLQHE